MAPADTPVFVIVPGGGHTPAHYSYLQHLLQLRGYPTISALLPSTGALKPVTLQDDTDFVRSRLLLPLLDVSGHSAIIVTHSYSGIPASAAARGLGKADRAAEGKATSVIGQIFVTSLVNRGGDGQTMLDMGGGQYPPFLKFEESANLISNPDPIPTVYQDVNPELAKSAVGGIMKLSATVFNSPIPPTSWHTESFKHRIAYVRAKNDLACTPSLQNAMIEGSGVDWILKDIDSGHSPQLSNPEELADMLVELAKQFEAM